MEKEQIRAKVVELLADFRGKKGALIPALQRVQEHLGYLPLEAMEGIAEVTGTTPNTVYGVTTFYAQFRTKPVGRKQVMVCRGTACHVRGSLHILEALERVLGIKAGETTPDMEYSLDIVACIGACGLAPTMRINEETYGKLTTKQVSEIFKERTQAKES